MSYLEALIKLLLGFFGVIAALVILFVCMSRMVDRQIEKRKEGLRRAAADLGLEFDTGLLGDPFSLNLPQMPLLRRGRDRSVTNVMQGKIADVQVMLFDYSFKEGSDETRKTYEQTVAAFEVPGANLPHFRCAPEKFWHGFADLFGFKDINFDTYPVFSKAYRLKGFDGDAGRGLPNSESINQLVSDNEEAVRELFNAEIIRRLESQTDRKWHLEGGASWLICHQGHRSLKPKQWSQFFLDAVDLCNALTIPGREKAVALR